MKIVAKKKFGQNFLKDDNVLHQIIQSMPNSNRNIVEIGPGLGDLTEKLLKVKKVKAYEVDDDLSIFLKSRFNEELNSEKFELIENDVLSCWKDDSLSNNEYDLIANLPYYIATSIILKALKDKSCKTITVMIQKEVALKFSAKPKQKEFCALSVLADTIADVKILFDVPPNAFDPMPKVVSSVIGFRKNIEYQDIFSQEELKRFEKFLAVAFKQPRKTLLKNLSQAYGKKDLNETFEKLELSSNIRAHEIDTKTYHRLFKILVKVKDDGTTKQSAG